MIYFCRDAVGYLFMTADAARSSLSIRRRNRFVVVIVIVSSQSGFLVVSSSLDCSDICCERYMKQFRDEMDVIVVFFFFLVMEEGKHSKDNGGVGFTLMPTD